MKSIELANITKYEENFRANPVLKVVSNALTDNAVDTICSVSEARNAERFHLFHRSQDIASGQSDGQWSLLAFRRIERPA